MIEVAAALGDCVDRMAIGASIGGPDPADDGGEYVYAGHVLDEAGPSAEIMRRVRLGTN